MPPEAALRFPATARNRDPILEVLRTAFAPPTASVLELASGSGEHALYFSTHLPHLRWQPTDLDPDHLASVEAWRQDGGGPNLLPARRLDLLDPPDDLPPVDAIFVANLWHISPWEVTAASFALGARLIRPGGLLVSYGPYRVDGAHTAPSNEAFDASLRSRDPRWGVRDVGEIAAVAEGFSLREKIQMPANNLVLIWGRG